MRYQIIPSLTAATLITAFVPQTLFNLFASSSLVVPTWSLIPAFGAVMLAQTAAMALAGIGLLRLVRTRKATLTADEQLQVQLQTAPEADASTVLEPAPGPQAVEEIAQVTAA